LKFSAFSCKFLLKVSQSKLSRSPTPPGVDDVLIAVGAISRPLNAKSNAASLATAGVAAEKSPNMSGAATAGTTTAVGSCDAECAAAGVPLAIRFVPWAPSRRAARYAANSSRSWGAQSSWPAGGLELDKVGSEPAELHVVSNSPTDSSSSLIPEWCFPPRSLSFWKA
jgi:hypothetical protein